MRSPERILVLCEGGRTGDAAIAAARDLAAQPDTTITVVGVAPRAPSGPRCGNSAVEYNEAIAESVARDLERARERLRDVGDRAAFVLLIEGVDQTVEQLTQSGGFDLVLLPARRRAFRGAGHPETKRLRRLPGAEVRVVGPRAAGADGS